jgi:predicted kinase
MRKWMRDKFKRRKKVQNEGEAAKTPAPLQPAYFELEAEGQQRHGESVAEGQPEDREPVQQTPSSELVTASSGEPDAGPGVVNTVSSALPSTDPNRRPRRRRRGGRGRKRPTQQAAPLSHVSSSPQTPSLSPPSAVSTIPQRTKGVVVLAIGLPGSGKSSWFKRHNITPLSSDMLRSLLFDDPAEQGFQDLVFSNLRSMLKARLLARRPLNYVDATNLTPHDRHSWIKLAKDFGYEVQAVFFDVPLEVCLERNHRRQRVVSDDVMREMSGKLKPPTFDEGFSKITVVRVKQQASA